MPLCTVGFGVGRGMAWPIVSGGGLLYRANLAAIVLSAFLVFYSVRMDSPDVCMKIGYIELKAASPVRLRQLPADTHSARSFGDLGQLRSRALKLLVTG